MSALIRTVGTGSTGASTASSFSPTMPVGFVVGDLLVGVANNGNGDIPTSQPSGATAVLNVDDGVTFNMDVVYKIATGGDVFTWTLGSAQKWAGCVFAYTVGTFDTVTPIQGAVGAAQGSTASTSFVTPSSTPGNSDSILLSAFGQQGAASWTSTGASPSMIEVADLSSSGTNPVSIGAYRSTVVAPVSAITRTGTASLSSANGGAMMLFVNPASVAAAIPPRRFRPQYRR